MKGVRPMKQISVLIKPASSLCNIRCKYCFYANVSALREVRSFGKMTTEVAEKMITNIFQDLADGDVLTLAFQGGEPTLAGLSYFEYIISLVAAQVKRVDVHYSIQTNGMVINEQWCRFLKANHFLVGLSIDGHPLYHDLNRVDPKGRGTFHRIMLTKQLFDDYDIDYNVLCVLTSPLAKEAKKVMQFIQKEQISYIQFIPCLADLDANEASEYALTPKEFAIFYHQLLIDWLTGLENGQAVSVKLFDDIINLLVAKRVTSCGMLGSCQVQYVIEADGSVYPCDFYVLDDYRMGYIQEETLAELFGKKNARRFICEKPNLPEKCTTCPFLNMCRGGCKRMKDAMYVDQDGYCGYAALLTEFLPQIDHILEIVEKRY